MECPGTSVKLFAGFLINSELKMHLNSSNSWKNDKLIPTHMPEALIETRYEKQHYIGQFLNPEQSTLTALKEVENLISVKLKEYCPKIETSQLKFYLFSQLFIH